ncbi:MAG: hypothetical protein Q3M24_19465 [Candidatus Electrothrix aestuarii]|uniref:DUF4864 domain-containing protein n=1 Tax=Candidatus Electrothrix aestuarii TaxID=3062594 RepID=A0AAU8LUB0_9BACT|nr:hypothetical protein [Candidatus Electrothrix aestuarii]
MKRPKKKLLCRALLILISLVILAVAGWYTTFILYPKSIAAEVTTAFEKAARLQDRAGMLNILSQDSHLRRLKQDIIDKYFGRFDQGIEITWCIRKANERFPSNEDTIFAGGKMKAKIDGQYREHFEFFLVQEGDQWKLRQFAFPDFIDY